MQLRDFAEVLVYRIALTTVFRGITHREGMLLQGPAGWGEFCPFTEYDDQVCAHWMATAVEAAVTGWPAAVRFSIPVNAIIPEVAPDEAARRVHESGCRTVKVKVAGVGGSLAGDVARVSAVRDALGGAGAIRVDANGAWDARTAAEALQVLDRAAGGLEYAEQPCATFDELRRLRFLTEVPIAADELIRRADDPFAARAAEVADVAIIKATPLGGVRRALAVAESTGLPCVVSSALETSIGLGAEVALAAALPSLEHACGLDTLRLFSHDVVSTADAVASSDGFLEARGPRVPDLDLARECELTDPGRVSWWWGRAERALALLG